MRRLLLAISLALSVFVCPATGAEDLRFEVFRNYLDSLRVQAGIPGLSAVIVGGEDILWERAFGQQDIARSIATRTDTPFHLDGLTQTFSAFLVLRCVEEGYFSLDDRVGSYEPDSPDANATIRQLLTHTSGPPDNLVFAYSPQRLAPLASVLGACSGDSSRELFSRWFAINSMRDSVPGPDAVLMTPPYEGVTDKAIDDYRAVLQRLAVPYAVDKQRRTTQSQYTASTLTPASGLISTARDMAQFDLGLRRDKFLRPETLAAAWQVPTDRNGQPLPHGLGWFVQSYNGETIVWQFGMADNASSSLMITVPGRGLTLILLANSDGLARQFNLQNGDVRTSPFGRVFLGLFVR
jgi:CubicO group peptidase (beta-lactamase class C family)